MKRSELFFSVLLIPVDALAVVTAYLLAYWFRAQGEVIYLLTFPSYLAFVLQLLPLQLIVFALEGLYAAAGGRKGVDELAGIFVGTSLGVLLVTASIFLSNTDIGSRIILLYAYGLSILLVVLGRQITRAIQRFLYRFNIGVHRVIVVGTNAGAHELVREITTNGRLGYIYLGHIETRREGSTSHERKIGRHLGLLSDLERIVEQYHPDELIVAQKHLSEQRLIELITTTKQRRIDLKLTPNLLGVQTTRLRYQSMAGIPILELQRTPLEGWGKVAKRLTDLVGAALAIVAFSPVMLLTAFAVATTSPGPIIYRNRRVGQDKRLFDTLKFRSMKIEYCTGARYGGNQALEYETELIVRHNSRKGAVYKVANDPRLTPIGAFLRRTSLDEFPQFFNVFFGTMSLVGPRPHQPREVEHYEPWQEQLFTLKPGITGLAQISGRSDLDFDDEARLDIGYIENWSFWTDLRILLRTPLSLLRSRTRKAA